MYIYVIYTSHLIANAMPLTDCDPAPVDRKAVARRVSEVCVHLLQVNDIALEDYIAVKPKFAVYTPHTAGRYQKRRFRKAQCPIVERYIDPDVEKYYGVT